MANKIADALYQFFLSERSKRFVEKTTLYVALVSFFVHLAVIYLSDFGMIRIFSDSELTRNPISALYTPFSFIIIYEVYLLIYYLPKSFTTYVTKQYEIISLIIIRKLFKDLSTLELTTEWFNIREDLQFTYDIVASLLLFYLIYLFQKHGKHKLKKTGDIDPKIKRFIHRKKLLATVLVPLLFVMAHITLFNWMSGINTHTSNPSFWEDLNNLFFDDFFTVLILVDVVLLLLSMFYTDEFYKIIRNSGFIISTILIRLSFGISGLTSTVLIVTAVLFGLIILVTHNQYEKTPVVDEVV